MNLSNTNELQMIYLGFSQKDGDLSLSVDGKEHKLEDFELSIKSIVDFVSRFSYNPIIAKIEVLDKEGFYVLSLDLPIMPAFLNIKDTTDISLLNNPEYSDLMKKRARSLTNGETQNLVNSRTCEYMNYIRHELACAYVRCISSGKDKLARQIQTLPVLNGFDISNFSNSNAGRVIYKTPQLLKYPMKIEGETFAKQYYMGLQEDVPDFQKDTAFWDNVSARDREYIKLDENLTFTLAQLKKKYGEMDFVSDNVSSTYTNAPAQFNF